MPEIFANHEPASTSSSCTAKQLMKEVHTCCVQLRYSLPMKSVNAEHVAEELVTMFACVGVLSEIFMDLGTNVISKLLSELYCLLHVRPIRASPYHTQTDSLVERFNVTLKSILCKTAAEGKD